MSEANNKIMPENPYQNPLDELVNKVSDISIERRYAISCYVPVFNIVTCVLTAVKMVESRFCLFHARQGLILFCLWFLTVLIAVLSPILSLMLWGVVLLLHIVGFVSAYRMQLTVIPVIGTFASKIPERYLYDLLTAKGTSSSENKNAK